MWRIGGWKFNKRAHLQTAMESSLPACEWDDETLAGFHIGIKDVTFKEMFGQAVDLSPICKTLLEEYPKMQGQKFGMDFVSNNSTLETRNFWKRFSEVSDASAPESDVDSFVYELFRLVVENDPRKTSLIVKRNPKWKLTISGNPHVVIPDIVVKDTKMDVVVLIVEDKSTNNVQDYPFVQVIAQAFAHFQQIQLARTTALDLPLAEIPVFLRVCSGMNFSFLHATLSCLQLQEIHQGKPFSKPLEVLRSWESTKNCGYRIGSYVDEFEIVLKGLMHWLEVFISPPRLVIEFVMKIRLSPL